MPVTGNTEQVGWLLYTSYLIPFEIASMLLLVAMIGAIVLAKGIELVIWYLVMSLVNCRTMEQQ